MKLYLLLFFIVSGLFLTSCGDGEIDPNTLVAEGGKKYGGEFKFMSSERITSLLPTSAADHYTSRIVAQIYESLLRLDPETMKTVPAVAESFIVSSDATIYTFKIRKGVIFHNDACFDGKNHELTAHDVKFSLELACSGLEENRVSYLLTDRIKGAKEFSEKSKKSIPASGVSGISVIDDYTLQITLKNSFSGFESILTHPSLGIFPKEAYEKYGTAIGEHPVGSGPFALESMSNDKIVLKRNNYYWRSDEFGNQLPFLSKVEVTYTENKRSELLAFRNAAADLVLEVPVEEIEHIFGSLEEAQQGKNIKHKVESAAGMKMGYIAMALASNEFKDVRVRKAFNIAISRDYIVDNWLEGEGWAANNGFVPNMVNYPNEKVTGHKYNVNKAKSLMAQAGYPNGNGFPQLDLYVNAANGSIRHRLCQGVANQLKENLNVTLNIKLCTIEERQEAVNKGIAKIWRAGWIADYPDAENFLALFYSGNIANSTGMLNRFKYDNDAYDSIYEKAIAESDPEKRKELLVQCDQMVIDDAVLMPLVNDNLIVMVNARIRGFKVNSMESLNLTEVFIKEPKN